MASRALPNRIETDGGAVTIRFDGAEDARSLLVLAPGAGAPLDSDFMATFARGLGREGLEVCRFNFPYQERGRRSPDAQPVLESAYRRVVDELDSVRAGRALFLGGKSMGGRIASHIVAQGLEVEGLVFLGYPLHPPGKRERARAEHLRSLGAPMLFVEGTRDPFRSLEILEPILEQLDAPTRLVLVEDGDHSFKVRKSSGRSTPDAWAEAIGMVAEWVRETASYTPRP